VLDNPHKFRMIVQLEETSLSLLLNILKNQDEEFNIKKEQITLTKKSTVCHYNRYLLTVVLYDRRTNNMNDGLYLYAYV
jgi:hypothetical protein